MQVTFHIPDDLAAQIAHGGGDISRAALESLAIEGYRTERLSESAIRRVLGFETRVEVHAFLKEHGIYLHYSIDDLERDHASAQRMRERRKRIADTRERLAG